MQILDSNDVFLWIFAQVLFGFSTSNVNFGNYIFHIFLKTRKMQTVEEILRISKITKKLIKCSQNQEKNMKIEFKFTKNEVCFWMPHKAATEESPEALKVTWWRECGSNWEPGPDEKLDDSMSESEGGMPSREEIDELLNTIVGAVMQEAGLKDSVSFSSNIF